MSNLRVPFASGVTQFPFAPLRFLCDSCREITVAPVKRTTVGRAAKENGISRRTLQRWVRDGAVPRGEDGTVDVMQVALVVGLRQGKDRRRGPKPGGFQLALQLGKTRTGRAMSDHRRHQLIVDHIFRLKSPLHLLHVHALVSAALGDESAKEKLKAMGFKPSPASPVTSSSVDSAGVPASVPGQ
jgi:hypothetical protein